MSSDDLDSSGDDLDSSGDDLVLAAGFFDHGSAALGDDDLAC
jgi:hypothetical protein